ncbi:hypothetical protein SAMN02745229_02495 [Butyrivibrio fibrisolvens DSM 3071]|uniref:Uncharacterized protein n=1 Tax=Butyrivibrio fibrisolvens DSM 3071 TaxID=1121131 RepID=A0A1M5ZP26_BUTFI|nr:DUF6240 domain-containing protein [Butyrivibrio fibrisolvens]SHI25954.1 hypothetical protein SAMN02745229_02495 [Butyrivibrio fibrisolvens DSM 3071]
MTNVSALGQFMASPEDNLSERISSFTASSMAPKPFGMTGPVNLGMSADVDLNSGRHDIEAYSNKTSALAKSLEQNSLDFSSVHNFDVVMSHTMSQEDYAKAKEDGFDMRDLDPQEAVTILDKVKTVLAQSGQIIDGYNDDLDIETLKNIVGNEVMAGDILDAFHQNDIPATKENIRDVVNAVEKGSLLTEPKDTAVNYLVENKLEPSVDNFYLADHATNGRRSGQGSYYMEGGYLNKTGAGLALDDIAASISEVIEEAGFEAADEKMQDTARKLLKDGLALTPDNLQKKIEIDNISFPLTREVIIDSAAAAIADGKKATQGSFSDHESLVQKAVSLKKSLFLEETRFEMSAEVNLRLLRSGITIDTSYVEKAVEELKAANDQIANVLFPDRSNALDLYDLYKKTNEEVGVIKESPAAVIGALTKEFKSATLEDIFNKGSALKASYEKAQATYEAVGTQVRSDLGDSIKKAFRNVDEVLKGIDLELTDDNRRAVRILSYNHAEVTSSSVEAVRAIDNKLVSTIDKLKPSAVLDMIREGRNPLAMTLDELGGYLDDKDKDPDKQSDKYSRFLYKLEKNGQITDKEKESYIGIYRLFENLKKTDHAAIGMVLETGSEMTIGNLLTANRTLTRSKRGMDFKFDDDFGGLKAGERKNTAIDVQIETAFRYYSSKADKAYDNISPEKMLAFENAGNVIENTLLPAFADAMEHQGEEEKRLEKEVNKKELEDLRNTLSDGLSKDSASELEKADIPVTVRNLEAMEEIIASRKRRCLNKIWDQLRERVKAPQDKDQEDKDSLSGANLNEALDSLKDLNNYKNTIDNMARSLETAMNTADTYIDIKAIKLLHKELSVASTLADKGSYEIPVDTGAGEVSLHISFKKGDGASSKVEASIETENYGTVKADLSLLPDPNVHDASKVGGMLTTSAHGRADVRRFMENIKYIMTGDISSTDLSIMYEVTKQTSDDTNAAVSREADTTDKSLIKTAELFIKAVTDSISMMEGS